MGCNPLWEWRKPERVKSEYVLDRGAAVSRAKKLRTPRGTEDASVLPVHVQMLILGTKLFPIAFAPWVFTV